MEKRSDTESDRARQRRGGVRRGYNRRQGGEEKEKGGGSMGVKQ